MPPKKPISKTQREESPKIKLDDNQKATYKSLWKVVPTSQTDKLHEENKDWAVKAGLWIPKLGEKVAWTTKAKTIIGEFRGFSDPRLPCVWLKFAGKPLRMIDQYFYEDIHPLDDSKK